MRNLTVPLVLILSLWSVGCEKAAETSSEPLEATYYLFRHAETVVPASREESPDPLLNDRGVERARILAEMLADSGVTQIFTSDFNRTRMTVEPLSEATGLEVEGYNPYELEPFADTLRNLKGKIAISGHSNTTPALVQLMGIDPGEPIDEKVEYDRLYIVFRSNAGNITGKMIRYGPEE